LKDFKKRPQKKKHILSFHPADSPGRPGSLDRGTLNLSQKIVSSSAFCSCNSFFDRFHGLIGGQDRFDTEDDKRLVFEELGLQ
jgi:hypothetical protein